MPDRDDDHRRGHYMPVGMRGQEQPVRRNDLQPTIPAPFVAQNNAGIRAPQA